MQQPGQARAGNSRNFQERKYHSGGGRAWKGARRRGVILKRVIVHAGEADYKGMAEICARLPYTKFIDEKSRTVTIYIPDPDLEKIIDEVKKTLNAYDKEDLIDVGSPDFVVSKVLEKEEEKEAGREMQPVEKLMQETRRYSVLEWSKVSLTGIAALIAISGLFLNNIEIVVGAMLLSPLLGPIYGFAISLGVGKVRNAVRSIFVLIVLLSVSIAIVAVLTFVTGEFIRLTITEQIASRMVLSPLYIPMAVLLGLASMLAMTRGIPEIAAGVAISVALIPPAAVAGILLVLRPGDFYVPAVIVAQNVLGLMAGALISVMVLNIGPRKYYEKLVARKLMVKTGLLVAFLICLTLLPFFVK